MAGTLFNSLDISASGLYAQRTRMNVISENIANAETTRTEDGGPYRRKVTILASGHPDGEKKFKEYFTENKLDMENTDVKHKPDEPFKKTDDKSKTGVHVDSIEKDSSPFKMVYEPGHPDANEDGYVAKPNVNIVQEMTELISATRSFDANVTAIESSKAMLRKALKI